LADIPATNIYKLKFRFSEKIKLLSNERDSYSSKRYGLPLAATITLFGFLILTGGLISSSARISSSVSSALDPTYAPSRVSSHGVSPPLVTSGISEPQQRTLPGPPAQQAQQYLLYESPQYGFSIQYPSDWQVREGEAGVIVTFTSPLESNFDPFTANVAIGIENIATGTSLDNYSKSILELLQSQPPGQDFKITKSPISTTLGGIPAQRIGFTVKAPSERSFNSESTLEGVQVWTIEGNYGYVLSFASEQDRFSGYMPVVEHIIDSFRISRTAG
jgi:hypothetical protein